MTILDKLTEVCLNEYVVNDHGRNYSQGILKANGYPIAGTYGLKLVTKTGNRLAVCGFEFEERDTSINIVHTPQGAPVGSLPRAERQLFLQNETDFRLKLLGDVLVLASSVGISRVTAIGSTNHFKVLSEQITDERGVEIIDKPLIQVGFKPQGNGDFYYDI